MVTSAGYVFATGWVLFAVALTAAVTASCFAITIAGIPLLAAAAGAMRGAPTPSGAGCGRC